MSVDALPPIASEEGGPRAIGGGYLPTARPRRIVVFRALQLGDLLCSIPALRALRASAPAAHIAVVGLPHMAGFVARYPHYVDEFIRFPGAPGFPEQPETAEHLPAFLDAMRQRRFDLAIQLHGSGGPANVLVRGFGAATTAGFHKPVESEESDSGCFVDWDAEVAEIRKYLALMAALGADAAAVADTTLELPVTDRERSEWAALARAHALDGARIACIHPGARWRSRRWPLERFAAVAADLARRGLRVVLTGSPDERGLVDALAELLRVRGVPVVDLCARTSLGSLAAMLSDSEILVSNDTGISHVAAALGPPSVVVASGSDVARWAPLDTRRHPVLWHDVPCRPCMYRDCPIDHPCARGVTVEAVTDATMRSTAAPIEETSCAA